MSGEGLAITWLGQAGFLLQAGGTGLLVDAFLSPHPERQTPAGREPAGYQGLAAVLATHEHIDHLDLPSWPALAAASPQAELVVPAPVTGQVTGAGLPPQRVRGAVPGGRLTLGEAVVTPLPARHGVHVADAYNFGEELSGGACRYLGYVVDLGGVRVYHAGDTIDYPELAGHLRELDVDLALLPVNGRDAAREARDIVGNLDPAEAADLAARAGVDAAVPMHYDMFAGNLGDPGRFVDLLRRRSSASAVVPAPQRAFCYRRVR
jgi:L-ascorbate metabolism protein UlaG (beta-lactamase superfamily)